MALHLQINREVVLLLKRSQSSLTRTTEPEALLSAYFHCLASFSCYFHKFLSYMLRRLWPYFLGIFLEYHSSRTFEDMLRNIFVSPGI